MVPELLVMVGASVMGCGCVAGLWLVTHRLQRLAEAQQQLVGQQTADRATVGALGRAIQQLRVECNHIAAQSAGRDDLREAMTQLDAVADAQRALERRWGLEHARSLARDGIATDLLVKEYGLTPAEARLIARLEPNTVQAH